MTTAIAERRVDAATEFRAQLSARGVDTEDSIIADDRVRRLRVNGERRSSVVYRLREEGERAFGWWRDHKSGETHTFRSTGNHSTNLTAAERRAFAEQIEQRRQREEHEQRKRHEKVAKQAARIWAGCVDSDGHAYQRSKGVDRAAKVYRGSLRIHGHPCDGAMVAPMRDIEGTMWGLQFICPGGEKLFLPGARKHGCFARLGFPSGKAAPRRVLITEGVATAYSVQDCTDDHDAIVVAFDAPNLLPVARAIRAKFSGVEVVFCADDDAYLWPQLNKLLADQYGVEDPVGPSAAAVTMPGRLGPVAIRAAVERDGDGVPCLSYSITVGSDTRKGIMLNTGRTKANQAAREIGNARVCWPLFRAREIPLVAPTSKATDFNDLHQVDGVDAVRASIDSAQQPAAGVSSSLHSTSSSENSETSERSADAWPDPEPLIVDEASEPYPLAALPPILRDAIVETLAFTQAPPALAACSALCTLSIAAQGLVNVRRDSAMVGPVSIYALAVADSGERKSTCDTVFSKPLKDFERSEQERLGPAAARARSAHEAWVAKRDGLRESIKHRAKSGKPTADIEEALERLAQDEPDAVIVPRLLFADVTPEQLGFALATGWPSAGILSAEGGTVLGSHGMGADALMRNLGVLNAAWGGEDHRVDRRTSASFELRNRRLSFGLMVQPSALSGFLERSGTLPRGTGFLARFLPAWPESTQGTRMYRPAPAVMTAVDRYSARIAALLSEPIARDERGGIAPAVVAFDRSAATAWSTFHDEIERELGLAGGLRELRDFGSKAAEQAARIAALFHVVERGAGGAISGDTMERACAVVDWHMGQAKRLLSRLDMPPALASAIRLDEWLIADARRSGENRILTRRISQYGPAPTRERKALRPALDELMQRGRVRQGKDGKRLFVEINPSLTEIAT